MQYVVYYDHILILYAERDIGMISQMQLFPYIIAIERDIQFAILDRSGVHQFAHFCHHLIGYIDPTRLNTDQNSVAQITMILEDLMTQPLDRNF